MAILPLSYTLTMTHVKTGGTIHSALLNQASSWVLQALDRARTMLPRGLQGIIHSDTGFITKPVDQWCQRNRVECTRSRPTRKNDNCSVEQKNSAAVRKIAGYFRCREAAGVTALQAVYDACNPLLNRHDPCMKQVRSERVGAEKKRTYDQAKTPFPRLFEQPFEDRLAERRGKAAALKDSTELVEQKQKMDRAVDRLPNGAQDMPVLPRRGTARQG